MAFRSAGHSRGLEDHGTTNQKNCSQQQLVSCGSGATELQLERLGLDYETSSSSESDEDGFLEVINTPQGKGQDGIINLIILTEFFTY